MYTTTKWWQVGIACPMGSGIKWIKDFVDGDNFSTAENKAVYEKGYYKNLRLREFSMEYRLNENVVF